MSAKTNPKREFHKWAGPHVGIQLRLPEHLHATVKASAAENSVSLNSEIMRRLERSLLGDELRGIVREELALSYTAAIIVTDYREERRDARSGGKLEGAPTLERDALKGLAQAADATGDKPGALGRGGVA